MWYQFAKTKKTIDFKSAFWNLMYLNKKMESVFSVKNIRDNKKPVCNKTNRFCN